MRWNVQFARQAPEGQSAAADGASNHDAPTPSISGEASTAVEHDASASTAGTDTSNTASAFTTTDAPPAALTAPADPSDVQGRPADAPRPDQAAGDEEDAFASLADAVDHLSGIVGQLADQVIALAKNVEEIKQSSAGGLQDELVRQAQEIMRFAMENVAKDFAELPAKVRAIEGKLKHF